MKQDAQDEKKRVKPSQSRRLSMPLKSVTDESLAVAVTRNSSDNNIRNYNNGKTSCRRKVCFNNRIICAQYRVGFIKVLAYFFCFTFFCV